MADYEKRYLLVSQPKARLGGYNAVTHHLKAQARLAGSADPWVDIQDRDKDVYIDASTLSMALAEGTTPEIVAAYKDAIENHINHAPKPINGWGAGQLEALLDADDAANQAEGEAINFIEVVMGLSYPIPFTL